MKNNKKLIRRKIYNIATILTIVLFIIMLVVFFQNITLKAKRNELNKNLEEYKLLKNEIDNLNEIKENYEIIIKNNEELESEKKKLKNKIKELNNQISNLNEKIDKLK